MRGGICQAFQKGLFYDAHHIDARSMYPSQMVLPRIPHGQLLTEKPDYPHATIYYPTGYLKLKPGKLAYLQFRRKSQCERYAWINQYQPGEYVNDCVLDGTLALWDAEIEIITECYETIDWDLGKRVYVEMIENTLLQPYIRELYKGKQTNTGTKKYYYKILLNALYGKFLSRPDGINMSYADGYRHKIEQDDKRTYYLPLGMFIAMMGRVTLFKAILSLPSENVLYCDTDSIIYIGDQEPNVSIGKDLGQWGIENDNFDAYIVGAKTYQERNRDGSVLTKCAGLSSRISATLGFMDIYMGASFDVLKSKRDPDYWFITLEKTTFKIDCKVGVLRERL